jgi:ankyrin repeat protein
VTNIVSLADAVWAGDASAVEAAIRNGVDVNAACDGRWPPLHLAIEQMEVELARRLIAAGAEVNRESGQGWTPLVHAIDVESDSAQQRGVPPEDTTTTLTELLLDSGAVPTEEAFRVARAYGNNKALLLMERSRWPAG